MMNTPHAIPAAAAHLDAPRRGARPVLTVLAAALMLMGLGGCGTLQNMGQNASVARTESATAADRLARVEANVRGVAATGQVDPDEVQRPFLAGTPVQLAPEVTLPPALRQNVMTTLLFRDGRHDLTGLAEAITRATGIPVRVKPDALLPMANFLPRAGGSEAKGSSAAGGAGGANALDNTVLDIRAEEVALNNLLDRVSSRLAVNWKFDGRAIVIYRLESRSFQSKALAIKVATTAGLGRNAPQGGAFDNASNTKFSSEATDPYLSLRQAIEARMTRAGLGPTISPETGTIVVTDTPEVLDGIAQYVARENTLLSRRVDMVFEAIQVRLHDNGALGMDWSLALQHVAAKTQQIALAPVASLVGAGAASLGYSVTGGRLDGSKVAIQALAEIGTVVSVTRVPVQTVNRVAASYAMRNTFNYVDQATSGSTASAAATTTSGPTITQKDETVGTILTVVPDVDDDGVIRMSVSYDSTTLAKLEPFTTGNGLYTVTVQQKSIDGAGVLQQISTRAGVPTVIGGFERRNTEATSRRMDKSLPLFAGGSDRTVDDRLVTVLMVTAVARDGQ